MRRGKVRTDIPLIPSEPSGAFPHLLAGVPQTSWFRSPRGARLRQLRHPVGVAEIAERVPLMAETSYSCEACNRTREAGTRRAVGRRGSSSAMCQMRGALSRTPAVAARG